MGYGPFTLYTTGNPTPRELMTALGVFGFEVTSTAGPDRPDGLTEYGCMADCSLTIACAYCGQPRCVGCGQGAVVVYRPVTLDTQTQRFLPLTLVTACPRCIEQASWRPPAAAELAP